MASLKDVKTCFKSVSTEKIDEFIKTIKTHLKTDKPRESEISPEWKRIIESGDIVLSFVNEKAENFGENVDLFKSGSQVLGVVAEMVEKLGNAHWAVAVIGHLLTKAAQMGKNRGECLQLLQDMLDLAEHINTLRGEVAERKKNEKLEKALAIIVKGSMLCAKYLSSKKKLFRYLKSSLDANNLRTLRSEIELLYPKLVLTAVIAEMQQQAQRLPVRQPEPPAQAVGLKDREQKVMEMLKMSKQDKKLRAVVIYGIGGIGKTILADSVYSKLNLKLYTFCKIELDRDPKNIKIKEKQEQILKDAFPKYNSGRAVILRGEEEGRSELKKAFEKASKPVFLFIDNVLRAEELEDLLPKDMEALGKDIRILLTARDLGVTNRFKKNRHEYLVKPLPDHEAKKLLCTETENQIHRKDVDRILQICEGIPLALKIVAAEFDKCDEILNSMKTGREIKMKHLTEDMVGFVFGGFEEFVQEAFLDICCFFNRVSRTRVESSVGLGALKALRDAALITIKLEYYDPMHEDEEIVVVHDVIKARGQNIAQSTRIRHIEAFERAVQEKRLNEIKGIELDCDKDHSSYVVQKDRLNLMSKSLRVLMLGPNISVSSKSKMIFQELKYVYLNRKIPFVPFNSENLPKLAVYIGPLLKGGVSIYKLPKSLVQISTFQPDGESRNWDETQVAPNSSLQKLSLTSFSMKTFPQGLDRFRALRTLMLDDWREMDKLPEVICKLLWLRTLTLVQCRFRHLPESFGNLKALTHLSLKNCDQLQDLPSTMRKLKALRYLNLKKCISLKKFPPSFGELVALQGLNLKECAHLKEIPGFEKMKKLRYMNIQGCPELRRRGYSNATAKGLHIDI